MVVRLDPSRLNAAKVLLADTIWGDSHDKVFDNIKVVLKESVTLAHPDPKKAFAFSRMPATPTGAPSPPVTISALLSAPVAADLDPDFTWPFPQALRQSRAPWKRYHAAQYLKILCLGRHEC
eukprot:IDg6127t1